MTLDLLNLLAEHFSRVCYVLTVLFNSALIYLTLNHTRQIVGTYRNMIVTFATFGITFSTADILVRPMFHSYNGCFIYFTLGSAFRFSKKVSEIALCKWRSFAEYIMCVKFISVLFSGVYATILSFLTIQFLYRASLLSKEKRKKVFDGWKLALWVVYTWIMAIIWGTTELLILPDSVTHDYLRNMFMTSYGKEVSSVPYLAVLAYNTDHTIRWNSVACIGIVSTIMIFHYTLMLICGVYMYQRTTESFQHRSPGFQKLQKQFFHALIYQTAAPTLFFHLPVMVVILAPFFDFKFSFNSSLVIYGFSAYPLIDSLIILKVVTEYKYACGRFMRQMALGCVECLGDDTPREETQTNVGLSRVRASDA